MTSTGNVSASFKRIIKLLDKWPVDLNKAGGRDLGEFLRCSINKAYSDNRFQTESEYWDKQYLAIQRLISNIHKNNCPRYLSSSSTGLTAEQCNLALSNDFLDHLKKKEESFFRKLISFKPDKK